MLETFMLLKCSALLASAIMTLAVTDQQFEMRTLPPEPFANSLGAFSGRPELVKIEFDAEIADYVASREWHRSQQIVVQDVDRS